MYSNESSQILLTADMGFITQSLARLGRIKPELYPAKLENGGAMALLCGRIDQSVIRLVGRWKSDAVFRYLHAQALPLIAGLAQTMLTHGTFTLLPGETLPQQILPTLQEYEQLQNNDNPQIAI